MADQQTIKRKAVNAKSIKSIGYDKDEKKLHFGYPNGVIWEFNNVPETDYDRLMNAKSTESAYRNFILGSDNLGHRLEL